MPETKLRLQKIILWYIILSIIALYWANTIPQLLEAGPKPAPEIPIEKGRHPLLMAIGLGFFIAIPLSFCLFIAACVLVYKKQLRPIYKRNKLPDAQAIIYLEAAVICLLYIFFIGAVARFLPELWRWVVMLPLLLIFGYLRLRGLSMKKILIGTGFYCKKNILIECFYGVLGYFALIPILMVGFVLTIGLKKLNLVQGHPIGEKLLTADGPQLLSLFVMACVMAPIFEELIFRGLLYNYLRKSHSILISALLNGFIFAAIHPQGLGAIPLLTCIAINLSIIREWRGSLIPSMAAHAANNFTALAMSLLLFRFILN